MIKLQAIRDQRPVLVALVVCLAGAGLRTTISNPIPIDTPPILTPARQAALDRIEPGSLKTHVSFLASDALGGRDTPSLGLDIAAEYIAAQFRGAGLEPAGDDGFFQTARWMVSAPDPTQFVCELRLGTQELAIPTNQISLFVQGTIEINAAPLLRVDPAQPGAVDALTAEAVAGKALVVQAPPPLANPEDSNATRAQARNLQRLISRARDLKAQAVVTLQSSPDAGSGLPRGRLIDPESRGAFARPQPRTAPTPVAITVHDPEAIAALGRAENLDHATLTLKLGPPVERPVTLRNVAGILRGSDPNLKNSYVIVSAHYDHVGMGGAGPDRIFNGANDDASGTAMVVELARALAGSPVRPRRSILFLTFFGEELGLLGSRYYGRHPLLPLDQTIAMINLEQVGRTDDSEGPQLQRASLTGFDFSEVGARLSAAGSAIGVEIFKHPRNSDSFFGRSDNQALADQGIPAHTLCVAFVYPDYHLPGDHWDKLDYDNMALIGRAVALGLLELADNAAPPAWNASNPRAARYREAAQKRISSGGQPHSQAGAP